MTRTPHAATTAARLLAAALAVAATSVAVVARATSDAHERPSGQGFSFSTGVDLVNVTATVTDASGRFVPGLKREDFVVLEDGKPLPVSQFDSDRVPVSLGIALDTSGSMAGEKFAAAQAALHRFLFDLLGKDDEVFLYRFSGQPELVHGWTTDRSAVMQALGGIKPFGGTALYDTVETALPMTQAGTRRKKALVIISDGMDTDSHTTLSDLAPLIRQSEVLVYAIGIGDGSSASRTTSPKTNTAPHAIPVPSPFPGQKPTSSSSSSSSTSSGSSSAGSSGRTGPRGSADHVNPDALRQITDESGGRTELIDSQRDLDAATAGIADELSRQYFLGYVSAAPKDGRWHTIEVQVRKGNGAYHVRARSGFMAGR